MNQNTIGFTTITRSSPPRTGYSDIACAGIQSCIIQINTGYFCSTCPSCNTDRPPRSHDTATKDNITAVCHNGRTIQHADITTIRSVLISDKIDIKLQIACCTDSDIIVHNDGSICHQCQSRRMCRGVCCGDTGRHGDITSFSRTGCRPCLYSYISTCRQSGLYGGIGDIGIGTDCIECGTGGNVVIGTVNNGNIIRVQQPLSRPAVTGTSINFYTGDIKVFA